MVMRLTSGRGTTGIALLWRVLTASAIGSFAIVASFKLSACAFMPMHCFVNLIFMVSRAALWD